MSVPAGHPSPAQAWQALREGNARFVSGHMRHPGQDLARRSEVEVAQHPFAVVFGCSDSRVASEIIFDRGLGDIFVVRTAGHVMDESVIGSIEFGVDLLGAPLVVVLGHSGCGAIQATRDAISTGQMPGGMVRSIVDRVIRSLFSEPPAGAALPSAAELGRHHIRNTVHLLGSRSESMSAAVAAGRCAIVGAEYSLADGQAHLVESLGDLGL